MARGGASNCDRAWGIYACYYARNAKPTPFDLQNVGQPPVRLQVNAMKVSHSASDHVLPNRTSIVDHGIAACSLVSFVECTDQFDSLWEHLDRATTKPLITNPTYSVICNHDPAVSTTVTT